MLPVPYTGDKKSSDKIIDAEFKVISNDTSDKKSKSFVSKVRERAGKIVKKGQLRARQYQEMATGKRQTREQVVRQQIEMRKRNVKKIAAAREIMESQAMGYQAPQTRGRRATVIKSSGRGIAEQPVEQPTGMDMMLGDTGVLRYQRTVYLEEPEQLKTHRSYGNFDFIGRKSKRGATMYQYDLEAMFR